MLNGLIIFLCLIIALPINVYANDENYCCSAKSSIVYDSNSNTVLYANNENEELPMASTTKIMTCFLACESDKLSQVVTVTDEMIKTEGSLIYLCVGDEITLGDLIKGALLASGNDAANAIAITLGGTIENFVKMMNNRAKLIGMTKTLFVTPSGLDEGNHHSTAKDMALLASTALDNDLFRKLCGLKSAEIVVSGKKRTVYNHNKLLSYSKNFVGVKTGYTEKAGRCLVSAYDYNGNLIICVTLNDCNDWLDHKNLIKVAKSEYRRFNCEKEFTINVVGANRNSVKCRYEYDVYSLNDIKVKTYYYPFVYSPIKIGDEVGKVVIYNDVKILKEVPITAAEGINSYG